MFDGTISFKSEHHSVNKGWTVVRTSMSRQAALSRVIWSAMVSVVKPGSCLANSTVFMMHFVESSLNLSQRSTSKDTRRSELLLCKNTFKCEYKYRYFHLQQTSVHNIHKLFVRVMTTNRSVFAELAERRESFLVCFANPVNHLLCVGTQHVALCALLLLLILLLLIPVVPHRCREQKVRDREDECVQQTCLLK